jgi:hypothetical protein
MVSPYALLSVALVRVAANTLPNLTLPPIVGGRGSLNLFCALVGPSGAGKSAVCAASDELLPWADPWVHIGSGEGLLHTFVERIKVDDPTDPDSKIKVWKVRVHTPKAAAIVDEIDTLTALGARQGSTLLPTLRTMWTGSSVGFGYADPSKRLDMKAHSYRLGMVVGAQPTRCEALFDEADAGTPQRFIWAPLTDPGAPDIPPDNPGPLVQPPIFNGVDTNFVVCESLRKATIDARQAMLRTGTTGELDGHALLNRIKIAAAIALMEGRYEVTEDDWGLSGRIQTVSDMTREWVQSRIANERAKQGQQRAEAKANEAVVVDHKLSDAVVGRVAGVIARAVHRAGDKGLTKNGAKQAVAKRDRDNYAAGIEFAVAAGWITEVERPHPRRADESVINYVPGKETP